MIDTPILAEAAVGEIAGLLAVAYQRHRNLRLVPVDRGPADWVNRELAIEAERSVHGGGQRQ